MTREERFELHLSWAGQIADDIVRKRPTGREKIETTADEMRRSLRQAAFLGASDMLRTLKLQGEVRR